MKLLLPTQNGTFILHDWHRLDTPTVKGVDWGAMCLADYHVTDRDSVLGMYRTVCGIGGSSSLLFGASE